MKILYLKSYYYPENTASSYLGDQTQRALVREGATIDLFTPMPSRGVDEQTRNKYKKMKVERILDGNMVIHRFPLFKEPKNTIVRAYRYILQCIKLFNIGVFNKDAKNADVIMVASTPPILGATAVMIKKFRKIPIVFNLQDIFPDSLISTGITTKGSLLWKIGRKLEDFTYRNSDSIIVISQDFKKNIMDKGVPEDKIEVIYNWVEEDKVVNVEREDNVLIDRYKLDPKKFYVTYCGNIGLTQNMDMFLDVAKELEKEQPNIHFVLVGEGAYKKRVQEIILEEGINNVTLLPFQPYDEISHVFSLGDVGLIISKPGVGANSVPSKTWSIMSASRPVIANFDENELKSIIEDNNCGIFTLAGDKDSFKKAILTLYNDHELCKIMGNNGRRFILENLTQKIGTEKYVNVVKKIVSHKNK